MKNKESQILMVGPDIKGLGGISRVVNIHKSAGLFNTFNIQYFSSTKERSSNGGLILLWALLRFVTAVIKCPSLVYVHTSSKNSFYRKLLFIFPALLFGRKVILHIHPTHFYDFLVSLSGCVYSIVIHVLKKMETIIVLTDEMKDLLSSMLPDVDIEVLRNPVDVEKMMNANNIQREKDRLLFLGWYIPAKGIYELVDAVEMLVKTGRDVQLNFYGTKQRDKLTQYVNKKKMSDHISVNGWINDKEKIDELYRSTALILPSHSEGIPNVILEAMSTGTPIISTHVGGIREVLADRENAIVINVKDAPDICEKIKWCFDNEQPVREIARTAYDDAIKKYDINVIKDEFKKIVKRALEQ